MQLLGLFTDTSNTSKFTVVPRQYHAMFQSAIILSQQYNITVQGQFIGGQSAQTKGDVMDALSNTCSRISNSNIIGIVGPELSRESHSIALFTTKVGIPVISYGATDPELSDRNSYSTFYRTAPSDHAAALALMDLFIQFHWTSCIVIYQNDAFGSGGVKAINEVFDKHKLMVEQVIVFDISTANIRGNLKHLLETSSARIVILWAAPNFITLILQHALENDVVGPQFIWILSSNIPLDNFDRKFHDKLIGMLIIEPVVGNVIHAPVNESLLSAAYDIWKQYEPETYPGVNNVDYYALFTFDATWTLIQALQKLCSPIINHSSPSCLSLTNTSYCFDRRLLNSTSLFNIINNNTFLGVSGYVQFNANATDRIDGSYYILKNVQRSSNGLNGVSVLVWSESKNWTSHIQSNTIIWPGNVLSPPSGHAELSGVRLRIGIIESIPFTMVREAQDESKQTETMFFGYALDLIELLRNKMGFIPNIILIPLNVSYNGLVDAVANNEYDMIVAGVTITAARMKRAAFSSSIFDNSLRIVIRETSTEDVDFLSYLRPFSFRLWITLLIASIYAGFLICLVEREYNETLSNESIFSSMIKSMWYTIEIILGNSAHFSVRTAGGRLLTFGLYILSLVTIAAYTAKLASDLTIAKTKGIISGIDDIKNGKLAFSRIGILANSSAEEYYLREISFNRNFYPLKNEDEAYEKLLNNVIDASIMDGGVLEYFTNNLYCNLTLVGADLNNDAYGIVFPKNWIYQQLLDVNILSLRELGVLDDLKRKWFQTSSCSRSSTKFNSMTVESMAGLFLTFGVISFLPLLLYVWIKRFFVRDFLFKLRH